MTIGVDYHECLNYRKHVELYSISYDGIAGHREITGWKQMAFCNSSH